MPGTRMFFCDPPGHTHPDNLRNHGHDHQEYNMIYFHDQEPVDIDVHFNLLQQLDMWSLDLCFWGGPINAGMVTSERDSDMVEQVCSFYGWRPYYYFFHGWAALDWYRGYDRTFLAVPPEHRRITHSFLAPNRIIGGKRDHRLLLMYHLLRNNTSQARISFPEICPVEHQSVRDIAWRYQARYPDIIDVFGRANLPWNFDGESGHPMHSCWLSLWNEVNTAMCYVVTETVFSGRRHHLTEKIFKPICQQIPFVLVSTAGSLEYLRSYGFKTFDSIWDESYDQETNDHRRLEMIADLLHRFDNLTTQELQALYEKCLPIIQHNYQHFYQGDFERLLSNELDAMLKSMQRDFEL